MKFTSMTFTLDGCQNHTNDLNNNGEITEIFKDFQNSEEKHEVQKQQQQQQQQRVESDSQNMSRIAKDSSSRCPILNEGFYAKEQQGKKPFLLNNLLEGTQLTDTLHINSVKISTCQHGACGGSIYMPDTADVGPGELRSVNDLKKDATQFLKEYYQSMKKENKEEHNRRLQEVLEEVDETSTYELTIDELEFGARLAWRNAPRCSGRIQWKKLKVFDRRNVKTAREMFDAILEHIKYATNGGNIRSVVTIFPQKKERMREFRVWNSQLIRYAGYKLDDGSVLGDPVNIKFTEICEKMGWKGKRTQFDVMPLILQAAGQPPEIFEIPQELILEVDITHPNFPQLQEMGLKWYGVPAVANMMFDCGGLQFTGCPFNGWYNATEIGSRNFVDKNRYNLIKPLADVFGFDTSNLSTLWKDKTVVEITYAVIHSYQKAGVTMVDHHSSSESFMKHIKNEEKLRGGCPTDWVWVVPPLSGGLTPMFHQEFLNYKLRPSYEYQEEPWKYLPDAKMVLQKHSRPRKSFKSVAKAILFSSSLMSRAMEKRERVTIVYASETGRSETFANQLKDLFLYAFNSRVICMDEYDLKELQSERCLIIVTSTFGNGDSPDNGKVFEEYMHQVTDEFKNGQISKNHFEDLRYSVFALGSRAYPNFCAFGNLMNKLLKRLGGEELYPIGEGDELCGQEESFQTWASNVFKAACNKFDIKGDSLNAAISSISHSHSDWKAGKFRLIKKTDVTKNKDICKELSVLHHKKVLPAKCISVENLQANESGRVTNLVRIDRNGNLEIDYQPGDHLSVFPVNENDLVEELLKRIETNVGVDKDVIMEIKQEGVWMETDKIPFGSSIRDMFTRFLDITTPPSQKLLNIFADQSSDDNEKTELTKIAKDNNIYNQWAHEDYPNILEVLQQYPSIQCDVTLLIHHLPLLKPRFYSISSSPNLHLNEIHVTASLVTYQVKNQNEHHGVCSHFLNNLKTGDLVPCFVRSAPAFHLPVSLSTPVLMIGPGTGIAPFRSFWQEAMYQHQKLKNPSQYEARKMELYFGCRNSTQDDIYHNELQKAVENGCLSKVHTAYSRQPGEKKVYVQHLLQQNSQDVGEFIIQQRGEVYVCGDVTMAADVRKTFVNIMKEYSKLTEEEAEEFISNLHTTGRYHEDIFGAIYHAGKSQGTGF